jgi:hypothetical protein
VRWRVSLSLSPCGFMTHKIQVRERIIFLITMF